jgi:hypothetical protein
MARHASTIPARNGPRLRSHSARRGVSVDEQQPSRQATSVTGAAGLFWWGVVGVGAFYIYDGVDLTIVLVDRVRNPHPSWADLAQAALTRI